MRIIELTASADYGYKAFFTEGLRRHPACFRISPADEAGEPFPTTGQPDSFTLAALTEAGTLAGVVSFQREGRTRERLRHRGLLFRMYVAREFAGQGLGQRLIEQVLDRAQRLGDLEQVVLTVVSSNRAARRLYERFGFETFGTEPRAIRQGDVYYDENLMVKRLG